MVGGSRLRMTCPAQTFSVPLPATLLGSQAMGPYAIPPSGPQASGPPVIPSWGVACDPLLYLEN